LGGYEWAKQSTIADVGATNPGSARASERALEMPAKSWNSAGERANRNADDPMGSPGSLKWCRRGSRARVLERRCPMAMTLDGAAQMLDGTQTENGWDTLSGVLLATHPAIVVDSEDDDDVDEDDEDVFGDDDEFEEDDGFEDDEDFLEDDEDLDEEDDLDDDGSGDDDDDDL